MATTNDELSLADGTAQAMGNGVVVVMQADERGIVQNVVLTRAALGRGDDLRIWDSQES